MKRSAGGAVAVVALLCGVAGCSSAGGGTGTTTTSPPGPTTTLPTPIVVGGTQPSGSESFLGPVMRVAVEALPAGGGAPVSAPAAAQGTYAGGAVDVGFRQFGAGPDFVLVMGQSGSMTWWDPNFLQSLAQHVRVTIFDLPAVGYSGPDTGAPPSVARYADVTAGLVDALGLRKPVLVGWGMGGEVVIDVLLRHPGLAGRAVLADTSAGGTASLPTPSPVAGELAAPSSTPAMLAHLLFPADASAAREAWLLGVASPSPDDVVPSALAAEARAQAGWWSGGAAPGELGRLALPVMVMWGTSDAVFPAVDGTQLAAAIPRDTVLTLPGEGFGALFESEGTVVPAIVSFATGS